MPLDKPATEISHEQVSHVMRRERRDLERLVGDLGADVARKLDRVLARDLVYERRQLAIADLFSSPETSAPAPHDVMVMLRSVSPRGRRRPVGGTDRRAVIASMQRAGARATERLREDLTDGRDETITSFWLTHSVSMRALTGEVVRIAGRGDVRSVSAIKPRFALTLDVSRPLIQADQVTTGLGFTGRGQRVAVLDTGVDSTHPALAGAVATQTDFTGLNAAGAPAEGVGDMHGHGTHCAGVVASRDRTRTGIAPGAVIDDIKIMPASGLTDQGVALAGIQQAVTAGVDVASNSWGFTHGNGFWLDPPAAGQPDGTCVLCVAADQAVAAGIVFVVAAGNEGDDTCSTYDTRIRCPGLAADAITVAATDDNDSMALFSSPGPTPDGRAKPDVAAPGVQIASCRAAGTSMGTPIDALFTNADGTSMAAPHVAGVAALMLQKTPAATPAMIKGALMSTAVNIGATPEEMGAGRVDALAAVNAI